MKYSYDLIHTDNGLNTEDGLYSLILLRASSLTISLNGVRCYLDGNYLLCLSEDDTLEYLFGDHQCLSLRFRPYFYNVNLTHRIIKNAIYEKMRSKYGYPSFYLFCERNDRYFGIVRLLEEEYNAIRVYMNKITKFIGENEVNSRWSCNARSEMISILNIAENAHYGVPEINENKIISYIRENVSSPISLEGLCGHFRINRTTLSNTIKKLTGLTPMQYVLEERLNQTRPELLFTNIAIGDLATKYGFGDVNYYIRTFKKRFGVTPLQYRTEGKNERIKNQNKYRLSEEQTMTIAEFESYLKKGLGRAVLLLKKEPDASIFRQSVLEHAIYGSPFDSQLEEPHGFFLAELFECFTDKDALIAEVLAAYKEECKPYQHGEHINNLEAWIKLDIPGAKETLWKIYERLFNALKDEEAPNSNAPNYERDDMYRCAEILYSVTPGSLKHFLHNAIILVTESSRFDIDIFDDFIRTLGMITDISFDSAFDELRDEDPRAEIVYQAYVERKKLENEQREERRQNAKASGIKKPTNWKEAIDFTVSQGFPMSPGDPKLWKGLSPEEHAEIIKTLAEETDADRMLAILQQLRRFGDEVLSSPSIDPTPLISLLESFPSTEKSLDEYEPSDRKKQLPFRHLGSTVAKIKHPAVRDFALRSLLMSIEHPEINVYSHAFEALLTNFRQDDDKILFEYIKKVTEIDTFHYMCYDVGQSDAPVSADILIYLYENCPCSACRQHLFEHILNVKTAEPSILQQIAYIKEEALYDSYKNTRELAQKEKIKKSN
ncbi:MAG: helix-turn-helix transcriptional regulator [Clostridia bacterium]|nr:helix-turn-helix transcriptional regulator [Clostridia bacterium]